MLLISPKNYGNSEITRPQRHEMHDTSIIHSFFSFIEICCKWQRRVRKSSTRGSATKCFTARPAARTCFSASGRICPSLWRSSATARTSPPNCGPRRCTPSSSSTSPATAAERIRGTEPSALRSRPLTTDSSKSSASPPTNWYALRSPFHQIINNLISFKLKHQTGGSATFVTRTVECSILMQLLADCPVNKFEFVWNFVVYQQRLEADSDTPLWS